MRAGAWLGALLVLGGAACQAFGAAEQQTSTSPLDGGASSSSGSSTSSSGSGSTSSSGSTSGELADASNPAPDSGDSSPKLVQKPQRFDGQTAGQYTFKYDSQPKAGSTAIIGLASSAVPLSVVVGTQSLALQSSIAGTVFVEIRSVEISAQNTGQVVVTFTTPATVALVLTEWSGLGQPSFIDPIAANLSPGSSLASTNSGAGKPGDLLFAMMGAVSVEPTSVSAPFTSLERGRAGVVGFGGASLVLSDNTARKAEWPLDNSGSWGALLVKFPAK